MGRKLGSTRCGGRGSVCLVLLGVWPEIHFTFISCSQREKDKRGWGTAQPACDRPVDISMLMMETAGCPLRVILSLRRCVYRKVTRAARRPGWYPTQGASTFQVQPHHILASWFLSCLHFHALWTHLFSWPGGQLQVPAPLVKVFCVIPPVAWRTLFSFIIVLVLTGENVGKEAKGLRGEGGKGS